MRVDGINYIGQKDKFRCGPIAIINALKFFNVELGVKDLQWLSKECDCLVEPGKRGTWPKDLLKVLKQFSKETKKFKIKRVKYDFTKLGKDKNKCHLINHYVDTDDQGSIHSHYILVIPSKGLDEVFIINPTRWSSTKLLMSSFYKTTYLDKKFKKGYSGLKHNLPMVWELKGI